METKKITLVAGAQNSVVRKGRYFRILKGSGTIQTRIDNGPLFELEQGIGIPRLLDSFEKLSFVSATSQTITVAISDEPIDDNRLTLSSSTLEHGLQRSLDNQAFGGAIASTLPGAGLYAGVRLTNSAASGVVGYVYGFNVYAPVGAGLYLVDIEMDPAWVIVGGPTFGVPKLFDPLVFPTIKLAKTNANAFPTNTYRYGQVTINNNEITRHTFAQPVILEEGHEFALLCRTAAIAINADFEWVEVPA